MCGISGIVAKDASCRLGISVIRDMTNAMVHRGPDAEGFFLDGPVAFGHRRLKIIDLEGGQQPIYNEDQTVVVVFNGEIYNFEALRTDLEKKGHTFKTHSDTEVIVHAYEEYGCECPKVLRGMFAFAIYDLNKRQMLLVRDRLGIKPLYYYEDNRQLVFASEIKAILQVLHGKPSVDSSLIDFYMTLGYVPGGSTLFRGIRKLLPGHYLLFRDGVSVIAQYWDLETGPEQQMPFNEAKDQLEELLFESIRLHLISDVPVGAFLSGGLDSSSVVAFMSRLAGSRVKTFSVGYSDDLASSELPYAKKVADHFGTEHHEFILESDDFFDSMEMLLEHIEEPIVESAAVALYRLSELAREHVTVILSGEGGDEILAGYPLYSIMRKIDRVHAFARWIPDGVFGWLAKPLSNTEKQMKYLDWVRQSLSQRYASIPSDVTPSIKQNMYNSDFLSASGDSVNEYFKGLLDKVKGRSGLQQMTYVDIKSWLPDDLLIKADKMTMACSLELRVPLLDHKLVEFCFGLPDQYRLCGTEGKYILKRMMEPYLPHEIIYRKKKGFPVPIAKWFREGLYEKVRAILLDRSSSSRHYFKPGYIERVLTRHRNGDEDLSRRIFSLLALELWHRRYVNG